MSNKMCGISFYTPFSMHLHENTGLYLVGVGVVIQGVIAPKNLTN